MYAMSLVLKDILELTGIDATKYIPIPPKGCPARTQATRLYSEVYSTELRSVKRQGCRLVKFFKTYTLPEVDQEPDLTRYSLYGFKFGDSQFRQIGVYDETSEVDNEIDQMYEDYPFIFIMAAYKVVEMLKRDTH